MFALDAYLDLPLNSHSFCPTDLSHRGHLEQYMEGKPAAEYSVDG
jgi:hypothetical protein